MPSKKSLFLKHVAQTSRFPMTIDIEKAEGMYIYDTEGKKYLDMDSGFSVSNLGHRHPAIIKAIKDQLDKYLHTTVYGEHIQTPQVEFAKKIAETLGENFQSVYYANGGAEAVEVAMKAARKFTGRYEIIACKNAYHGSSLGAESLRSDTDYTSSFLPAVPGIRHITFNSLEDTSKISSKTAAVIFEPVQAEAGVIEPTIEFLNAIKEKCKETGALLIYDEIQTGFGRTGSLFAFQKYGVSPDILLMAKAMGGGMPVGAVVSSNIILDSLCESPSLGHINTFGGHPVCIAAACANLEVLLTTDIIEKVASKESLIKNLLKHHKIKEVRSSGLLMAVSLHDKSTLSSVVDALKERGIIVDYFLFNDNSFRIAPPLIIDEDQIKWACGELLEVLDKM